MMKDDEKETILTILEHIEDAKELITSVKPAVSSLIKEAASFYAEVRKPLHKLNDEVDKQQAERLYDLLQNVGLDSKDAVDLLLAEKRAVSDTLKQLVKVFNLNTVSAVMHYVLPLFMGMIPTEGPIEGVEMEIPEVE